MQTSSEIVEEGLQRVDARLTALRLSASEFLSRTGVLSYSTYWRAKKGVSKPLGRLKTLRTMERALDQYEARLRSKAA